MRRMIGLTLVLLVLPAAAISAQDAKGREKRISDSLRNLEIALKYGSRDEKMQAISGAALAPDARVSKALGRFWKETDPQLLGLLIRSLRTHDNPVARRQLLRGVELDSIRKDVALASAIALALGQSGDADVLPGLVQLLLETKSDEVFSNGTMSIARIRSRRAVDKLVGLLARGGSDVRVRAIEQSLSLLTGRAARGMSATDWMSWWNAEKSSYRVAEKPTLAPGPLSWRWQRMWRISAADERMSGQDHDEELERYHERMTANPVFCVKSEHFSGQRHAAARRSQSDRTRREHPRLVRQQSRESEGPDRESCSRSDPRSGSFRVFRSTTTGSRLTRSAMHSRATRRTSCMSDPAAGSFRNETSSRR